MKSSEGERNGKEKVNRYLAFEKQHNGNCSHSSEKVSKACFLSQVTSKITVTKKKERRRREKKQWLHS